MATPIPPEVLRRLLLVKQQLAAIPPLTPTSDALGVARALLAAHDAAELALATIADRCGVQVKERAALMDYADALNKALGELAGLGYLSRFNHQRITFKHKGNLPNVPDWHHVGDDVRRYVEQWCRDHLDVTLSDLEIDVLIEDAAARALYLDAKARCDKGDYRGALEVLAQALYEVLRQLPGVSFPVVGKPQVDAALRLAAFGVNAGDFLTLQELLPTAWPNLKEGTFSITWDTRSMGHAANWHEDNVRFALSTFVDVAIKIQHAPWAPWPVHFNWVYENTLTARHDGATVWREPDVVERMHGQERKAVATYQRGHVLRGFILPTSDPRMPPDRFGALAPAEFEHAKAFQVVSDSDKIAGLVFTDDFELGSEPKDEEWVRKTFPHIFEPRR